MIRFISIWFEINPRIGGGAGRPHRRGVSLQEQAKAIILHLIVDYLNASRGSTVICQTGFLEHVQSDWISKTRTVRLVFAATTSRTVRCLLTPLPKP